MQHSEEEKGIGLALLKRLVDLRIPRLLEMKKSVDSGKVLTEIDIDYLQAAFEDANHNKQFIKHFPEYEEIIGKVAQLYEQITSKALENERTRK